MKGANRGIRAFCSTHTELNTKAKSLNVTLFLFRRFFKHFSLKKDLISSAFSELIYFIREHIQ